jgi:CRP/FNR family transcriptional regulator
MPSSVPDLPSRTFEPGEVIFRQGDRAAGEAYLVHEGSVEVRRAADGQDHLLRTLVQGDLLGEVALFRDAPHSATAVALEPTTLLVIPSDRLEHMVTSHPRLAIALIRQLARMAAGDAQDTGHESSSARPEADR